MITNRKYLSSNHSVFLQWETELTPENIKKILARLNMSIRQAADEIGIAHTTLSRYINRENKRQNKKNEQKMKNLLEQKLAINKDNHYKLSFHLKNFR